MTGDAESTPRWVKVFALVALVLVVAVVVLLVSGRGGGHGPRRHAERLHPAAPPANPVAVEAALSYAQTPR